MKNLIVTTALVLALGSPALAGGNHKKEHGHEDTKEHHTDMAVGRPGKLANVQRTIAVDMKETADGAMIFEPKSLEIRKGETIRFEIRNVGELKHEFVLDDHHGIMEHKDSMERFPEMEHDDPSSVHLESGETGELIWAFTKAGEFEFACLIPGHYDSGMKGDIAVVEKLATN